MVRGGVWWCVVVCGVVRGGGAWWCVVVRGGACVLVRAGAWWCVGGGAWWCVVVVTFAVCVARVCAHPCFRGAEFAVRFSQNAAAGSASVAHPNSES